MNRQLWIEMRAAELAAAMLTNGITLWVPEELAGWMRAGDGRDRGRYPKSKRWEAGYLAAIIWDGNRKQDTASPLALLARHQIRVSDR